MHMVRKKPQNGWYMYGLKVGRKLMSFLAEPLLKVYPNVAAEIGSGGLERFCSRLPSARQPTDLRGRALGRPRPDRRTHCHRRGCGSRAKEGQVQDSCVTARGPRQLDRGVGAPIRQTPPGCARTVHVPQPRHRGQCRPPVRPEQAAIIRHRPGNTLGMNIPNYGAVTCWLWAPSG